MSVIAFDLETVPCPTMGRRAWGLEGSDETVSRAMLVKRLEETAKYDRPTDFQKHPFWRIVALGMATLKPDGTVHVVGRCGPDEQTHIETFGAALRKQPVLVGYNSSAFDLPVLRFRALFHGINLNPLEMPARDFDRYLYRYGDRHIDLGDDLTSFGAARPMPKLSEFAALLDLPPKTEEGGDVLDLWYAGDIERIERYVARDAALVLAGFFRREAMRCHPSFEETNQRRFQDVRQYLIDLG